MKLLRSLLLLAGLAALPACASSEGRDTVKPFEPTPTVQAQAAPSIPVPVAAPALAAPRSFVVHFDFDSADIRASAMQILYEASQVAGRAKPTAIRIHGFTDASGKSSYNQRLSERRAKAVADQLSKLGVKVATVETKGFGKANPAAKTKGKSKDNRRVEIVFEGGDVTKAATEAAAETGKTASVTPHAVAPLKAHHVTIAAVTTPTRHFSPAPQSVGKQAIKRDRVQIGSAWIPPAPPMTDVPSGIRGRVAG